MDMCLPLPSAEDVLLFAAAGGTYPLAHHKTHCCSPLDSHGTWTLHLLGTAANAAHDMQNDSQAIYSFGPLPKVGTLEKQTATGVKSRALSGDDYAP